MVSHIWALTIITTVSADVNNYTYIKEYEDRMSCEIKKVVFINHFGPFADNEQVRCLIFSWIKYWVKTYQELKQWQENVWWVITRIFGANMKKLFIAIIFVLLGAQVFAQDFDEGLKAYRASDYETAFKVFEPLANKGMPEAQFYLG